MTEIVIKLERGPDGQPAGQLSAQPGLTVAFTGWLDLVRLLEAQLPAASCRDAADGASGSGPGENLGHR